MKVNNMENKLLEQLEKYRDLKITKEELMAAPGFKKFGNYEILLTKKDLIRALKAFVKGDINQEQLLEWINFVWFSDWYAHGSDRERMALIIYELEEIDERIYPLKTSEVQHHINVLENNR